MAEGFAEHRRMAQEQALEMARDGQQAVLEVHPHLRPVRRAAGFPATPEQPLAVIREQPRQGDQDEVREQLLLITARSLRPWKSSMSISCFDTLYSSSTPQRSW